MMSDLESDDLKQAVGGCGDLSAAHEAERQFISLLPFLKDVDGDDLKGLFNKLEKSKNPESDMIDFAVKHFKKV
jgi:hypothetical protein